MFFQTWCMIFICVLDVFLRMKDIDPRRLTLSGRPQPVAPQMAAANRPAPPRQSYAQPGKPSGCQWFFPWVFLQKMVDIYIYCCRYYIWCMYIWCTQLCIMYMYMYIYIVSIVAHNYLILYIIYVYMYVYILYIYICNIVCIYISLYTGIYVYNYMIIYVRIRAMTRLTEEMCVV